jgi:TPR repeat protein
VGGVGGVGGIEGVAQDCIAAQWYALAAAQGHAGAQYNLACVYISGRGHPGGGRGTPDWNAGATYLLLAALQGHVEAQYTLGNLHSPLPPLPPLPALPGALCAAAAGFIADPAEAVRFLTLAAAQGHAWEGIGMGV